MILIKWSVIFVASFYSCLFVYSIVFLHKFKSLAQSETTESSQPTRSLVGFLAPRNLSVSWPSMLVTPRTTKHICFKKTIIRNISSKDFTTSHHVQTSQSPLPHHFSSLFIKFLYTIPQVSSTTLIIIHQPPLSRYFGKILK